MRGRRKRWSIIVKEDEGDVKETSGWHLFERGPGDRRGCYGEQFGPVITDKQRGSGGRERGGPRATGWGAARGTL